MIKTKHLLFIFIPAIIIVGMAFFIRLTQYKSLLPDFSYEENKVKKVEENFIPIFPDDPIIGKKNAGITIIAFEDIACEACREQMAIFHELLKNHAGKIKIIWKGLSVKKFPYSSKTAHAYAYCANQQNKFNEFELKISEMDQTLTLDKQALDLIISDINIDKEKLSICLSSGAPTSYQKKMEELAKDISILSLPTIFIDNKRIEDNLTYAGWESLLGL